MAADGGCERDVVHRMTEEYRAWGKHGEQQGRCERDVVHRMTEEYRAWGAWGSKLRVGMR